MGLSIYQSKLVRSTNLHVNDTGGQALVVTAGGYQKVSLFDRTGLAATNPVAIVGGVIEFYTLDSVKSVDLYIMTPGGQFLVKKSVARAGPNEFVVDEQSPYQLALIPFHTADYTAASEVSTGIQFPEGSRILPTGAGVYVATLDDTETIEAGLLSTESGGDADGFLDAIDLSLAGFIPAGWTISTSWPSATTIGLLLRDFTAGSGTDDRGSLLPKPHVITSTARTVSITLTAGTDTAAGLLVLPYHVPVLSIN